MKVINTNLINKKFEHLITKSQNYIIISWHNALLFENLMVDKTFIIINFYNIFKTLEKKQNKIESIAQQRQFNENKLIID